LCCGADDRDERIRERERERVRVRDRDEAGASCNDQDKLRKKGVQQDRRIIQQRSRPLPPTNTLPLPLPQKNKHRPARVRGPVLRTYRRFFWSPVEIDW
jgi:hypothetical protein